MGDAATALVVVEVVTLLCWLVLAEGEDGITAAAKEDAAAAGSGPLSVRAAAAAAAADAAVWGAALGLLVNRVEGVGVDWECVAAAGEDKEGARVPGGETTVAPPLEPAGGRWDGGTTILLLLLLLLAALPLCCYALPHIDQLSS